MERYEKYKDSGVEWIGEIPAGWEVKKLKRFSIVKRGASPRPIADPKYFDNNGEWAWVRIADVSASERYLESTTQTLSDIGASLSVKMEPGSIFLSIAGTVGKPIITKIKCCIHDGFVYFPFLKLNPEYLYYIFSTGLPYQGLGKWGTQLNLNTDTVGEIEIPLPRGNEVAAIANYLDRKTAEIDELIAQKQRLLELYEEEKTAIINQAVTKGIDPDVKLRDSGIDWLGEIPEGWEVKKLKYVAKAVITGKTPSSSNAEFYNGDVNWFAPGDFNFGLELTDSKKKITNYAVEKSGMKVFPKHSILLVGIGATVGKMGIAKCSGTSNQQINAIIVKEDQLNPYFALYFLLSVKAAIIRLANAATLPIFNQTQTKEFEIFIPEIAEQTAIVHHIETETTRINAKIAKTKKIIALQKEYRTALISEVVTGKIKVTQEVAS